MNLDRAQYGGRGFTKVLVKGGRVMGVMDVVDFLYDGTPASELDGLVFACPLFDIPGVTPKTSIATVPRSGSTWRARRQWRSTTG